MDIPEDEKDAQEIASENEAVPAEEPKVDDEKPLARPKAPRGKRATAAPAPEANGASADSAHEDDSESEEEPHREEISEGEEDPLAPGYDLDDDAPFDGDEDRGGKLPWSTRVESAKEFFNSELVYRYDLLEDAEREPLKGTVRIEVKGYQGGVWTLTLDEDLDIANRREDADTVLTMHQRDFLQLVNGQLNPQLAILAQKIRIMGDFMKGIAFHSILSPVKE